MVTARPLSPAHFDDLYRAIQALPEHLTGEIIEPGEIRAMNRPGNKHRRAHERCMAALAGLNRHYTDGTGWWIEHEPALRLSNKYLLVPDLAGWRVERVPRLPDENPLTLAPDWVAEILSPSTARDDRRLKLPIYAQAGVPWVWLIDPEQELVEVFETVAGRPTLVASAHRDNPLELQPFPLPINFERWWSDE